MLKKMVVIFTFVFLAINPAYPVSPEQPNSIPQDTNSSKKWMPKSATLVEESPNSVPTEPNTRIPDIFDTISDNEINSITADSNSPKKSRFADLIDKHQNNSVVPESNSELTYLQEQIEKANKGDANAQSSVGGSYYHGWDVKQNYNEAFKWYKKAAEQENAHAQRSLGFMYARGEGVQQDYNEAVKWLTKAAKQGEGLAQQILGEMYYNGEGVPKDYNEALKWLTMSVQSIEQEEVEDTKKFGDPEDQKRSRIFLLRDTYFTLGIMHYNGKGTPQDYNEAFKWFTKAADSGIIAAQYNVGFMYSNGIGVPKDNEKSVKWFTLAAMKGNIDSQNNLGVAYEFGDGVSQDYKESVQWYRISAEQGCARAQRNLARMYFEGKGVIEDYVEAYKWALIAGMNSENVTTIKQLCSDKMTYAQIAKAQKLAKEFVAQKENEKDEETFDSEERTTPKSSGTGFFISPSGYLITAAHVVEKSHSIQIFTSANISVNLPKEYVLDNPQPTSKFQAKVILLDKSNDIAILKVDGAEFSFLKVISSSNVTIGDKIFTIGFPNITVQGSEPKYTDGTISSLSGIDNNIRRFQISIPVQPGNSGGPLVTEKGEVIGVVVSRLNDIGMLEATGTLPQNVNYAVKSAFILPLLENLPGWQNPKAKPNDEKMSNSEIINKARNTIALILVY